MKNSFMFKDADGKPLGFLQQIQNKVRCRIQSDLQSAEIILMRRGGACDRKAVSSAGEECEWRIEDEGGRELIGACLLEDGEVVAFTGAEARRMYMQRREKRAVTAKETSAIAKEAGEIAKETSETAARADIPQRRWPPHPCCLKALYQEGAWVFNPEDRN